MPSSTAQKINQKNAKKALIMSHKDGISLKQAWKIVKSGSKSSSRKSSS